MNNIALVNLLREKNTRITAMKMFSGDIIDVELASDFDVFDILCENLYLLAGNSLRERFLNLLCEVSHSGIVPMALYNREYRKLLWQKIFSSEDIMLPSFDCELIKTVEITEKPRKICLNSLIDTSFENIYDLLENTLKKIKSESAEECFFDATEITYIRPDDFHAQKEYEKLKNGDSESSVLALWLLCRILMNTSLNLRLKVDSQKKAEDILSLVFRLGLYPKTVVGYDASVVLNYKDMYQYLIDNYKKNISLELDFSKEKDYNILELLHVIPLAFVERINVLPEVLQDTLCDTMEHEEISLVNSYLNRGE